MIFAFAFVLGLMLILAWALRRFGVEKRLRMRGPEEPCLSLAETFYLDSRHRIVIIRRGKKRHVMLLGQQGYHLLESYDEEAHHAG